MIEIVGKYREFRSSVEIKNKLDEVIEEMRDQLLVGKLFQA